MTPNRHKKPTGASRLKTRQISLMYPIIQGISVQVVDLTDTIQQVSTAQQDAILSLSGTSNS